MVLAMNRCRWMFTAAIWVLLLAVVLPVAAWGQGGGWEVEWQATIVAAKKEGRLVYHAGDSAEPYFNEFGKKYPEIKVVRMLTRRGSAVLNRVMAERRARVYVADVVHLGAGSGGRLANAGAFDAMGPFMILPEVLDKSAWFEGKHYYADEEQKFLFKYASFPGVDVSFNTKLVSPKKIKSYWDILDKQWKGKIITYDPNARGSRLMTYFHNNPELGARYLTRLFTEMDIVASRDHRQIADWLARGKYAIALRTNPQTTTLDQAKAQGLPVDWFVPGHFKEAVPISGGPSHIGVLNQAPHPNAAKLFVNWFLSREGQLAVQNISSKQPEGVDSRRIDIPKDMIPVDFRRTKNRKFFDMDAPQNRDDRPALKFINGVWKKKN